MKVQKPSDQRTDLNEQGFAKKNSEIETNSNKFKYIILNLNK